MIANALKSDSELHENQLKRRKRVTKKYFSNNKFEILKERNSSKLVLKFKTKKESILFIIYLQLLEVPFHFVNSF